MSDIKVNLDVSALTQYLENFAKEITKDLKQSIHALATGAHNHIKKDAQKNLHSFRQQYLDNLSPPEKIDDFLWVITLNEKAEWIETGRPQPYDMKIGLLKKGKLSKDGVLYRVVPMNQGKAPTEMSSGNKEDEQEMVNKVRAELKKKGIPYKKLEVDSHGSPRHGGFDANGNPIPLRLHTLNIDSHIPGKGVSPQLHGINIYQTKHKDGSVKRSITTFRTVTSSEDQQDKWIHPPVEARNFFEKAKVWAEQEFETIILPALMEKYK